MDLAAGTDPPPPSLEDLEHLDLLDLLDLLHLRDLGDLDQRGQAGQIREARVVRVSRCKFDRKGNFFTGFLFAFHDESLAGNVTLGGFCLRFTMGILPEM